MFALWLLGWGLLVYPGEPISTQHSPPSWLGTASSRTATEPAARRGSPDTLETFCWRGGGGGGGHAHVAHQLPAQKQAGGSSPAPTARLLRAGTWWALDGHLRLVLSGHLHWALDGHLHWQPRAGAGWLLTWHPAVSPHHVPCPGHTGSWGRALWPHAGAQTTSFLILMFTVMS